MKRSLGVGGRRPYSANRLGYVYGQDDDASLSQIVDDKREAFVAKKKHQRLQKKYRRSDWNKDTPRPISLPKFKLPD